MNKEKIYTYVYILYQSLVAVHFYLLLIASNLCISMA